MGTKYSLFRNLPKVTFREIHVGSYLDDHIYFKCKNVDVQFQAQLDVLRLISYRIA